MINKLIEKIQKTHAPIVVGLDPMLNYVPEHIQKELIECADMVSALDDKMLSLNDEVLSMNNLEAE